jgi:hypothetical protein
VHGGRGVGAGGGFTGVLQLSGADDCVGAGVVGGDSTFLAAAVVAALARLVVPLAARLLVAARLLLAGSVPAPVLLLPLPLPLPLPLRLVVTPAAVAPLPSVDVVAGIALSVLVVPVVEAVTGIALVVAVVASPVVAGLAWTPRPARRHPPSRRSAPRQERPFSARRTAHRCMTNMTPP